MRTLTPLHKSGCAIDHNASNNVPFCDDQHRVRLNIETEFTRIPAARLSTLFRRGVRRLRVTQQRERERRPGFKCTETSDSSDLRDDRNVNFRLELHLIASRLY